MKLKNFAMITEDKVFRKLKETPEIFCIADDFCKVFDAQMVKYTFMAERKRKYHRESQLLNFMITPGDVDDRKPLEYKAFVEFVYGKLVGDKGYIGKRLFERLFVDGIQLITKLKSNMKGALMSVSDKLLLRKRAIIETVNDELKNIAQVEHSWHRSFGNFVVNLLGGIAAYCYFPKKPSIRVQTVDISNDRQLTLF